MAEVSRREPGPQGKALKDEFRDMVKGDYGGRCQICGRTFTGSGQQVFVVPIVRPSDHEQGNHFGNLLGVCGWHYALVQYGKWSFMTGRRTDP